MKKKVYYLLSLLVIISVVFLMASCGNEQDAGSGGPQDSGNSTSNGEPRGETSGNTGSSSGPVQLTLGMPPSGTSYNSVGSGVASVITQNSNLRVTGQPYDGLSSWAALMNSGDIDLGVGSAPEAYWVWHGDHGHQKNENIRLVLRGHFLDNAGLMVPVNAGINKVADLKGKPIASDYPGSLMASQIILASLELNGMTWNDVTPVPVANNAEGAQALRDGRVVAAFALSPDTAAAKEVDSAIGIKALGFLDDYTHEQIDQIPAEVTERLQQIVPGTEWTVVKPNGYIKEDLLGIKYEGVLMAGTHVSNEIVYQVMETLWEHYEQLHPIHGWLKQWSPEIFFDERPALPYHDGAIQFFKDKGLWNNEVEEIQQSFFK